MPNAETMPAVRRRFAYTRAMFDLRDCRQQDLPQIRELNEAAIPAVNRLSLDELEWFRIKADYFRVAVQSDVIGGFLVGLKQGREYASENYRWFSNRFRHFAYIDRIVVGESARRRGLASRFYRDFAERCGPGSKRLVCEVNLKPPNDSSMQFHERMGFTQIDSQATEGGRKQVALLMRTLEHEHA